MTYPVPGCYCPDLTDGEVCGVCERITEASEQERRIDADRDGRMADGAAADMVWGREW